jgi:HD superfamily phosphodiesterase
MSGMPATPPIPEQIAGIAVPRDDVSRATWAWANRALPEYLLAHSVRSYCWGAAIAGEQGWSFDRRILWIAALWHDYGLTRIPRNTMCFEIEGAELARGFLRRAGLPAADVDRVAIAIILHMQPGVTLADGVESALLDQATGVDVRGDGYERIRAIKEAVVSAFPRRAFDRHFLAAIRRETAIRRDCQSQRLLETNDLAGWMARSPWAPNAPGMYQV